MGWFGHAGRRAQVWASTRSAPPPSRPRQRGQPLPTINRHSSLLAPPRCACTHLRGTLLTRFTAWSFYLRCLSRAAKLPSIAPCRSAAPAISHAGGRAPAKRAPGQSARAIGANPAPRCPSPIFEDELGVAG
jgi:hypothetical protein